MHPIPIKLRQKLSESQDMKVCIHNNSDCSGRVEWEHAWTYAGKQIQEEWAIIPCCTYHHRGKGLDKDFNRYKSLMKVKDIIKQDPGIDVFLRYPKKNWLQEYNFLKEKYEKK